MSYEVEFEGVWFVPRAIVAVEVVRPLRTRSCAVDVLLLGGHTVRMGEDREWSEGDAARIADRFTAAMSRQVHAGADFADFTSRIESPDFARVVTGDGSHAGEVLPIVGWSADGRPYVRCEHGDMLPNHGNWRVAVAPEENER